MLTQPELNPNLSNFRYFWEFLTNFNYQLLNSISSLIMVLTVFVLINYFIHDIANILTIYSFVRLHWQLQGGSIIDSSFASPTLMLIFVWLLLLRVFS